MIYSIKYFTYIPIYTINNNTYLQITNCLNSCSRKPYGVQKNRGKLSYSKRKLSKQKGTGCARHGSKSSPTMRGGGRSFPGTGYENYKKKINRKMMSLFTKSILYKKYNYDNILIYNNNLITKSTKAIFSIISLLTHCKKSLVVTNNIYDEMSSYSKNISNITISNIKSTFPISLIKNDYIIVNRDCFKHFLNKFLNNEAQII
ncbi:50S ribosomal protein L4 [Candidatus Vidania fulgoroideae]|uniref:Large ribosomal subunit protein uL4 n=1 Tax=Candidatus Vidania fulgoroideorum TaxID=881286 RepID=A0A975AE64_9PROT|nr:50S ribosomal protein L4 [Candidatus Vidania fulgoroideae]